LVLRTDNGWDVAEEEMETCTVAVVPSFPNVADTIVVCCSKSTRLLTGRAIAFSIRALNEAARRMPHLRLNSR
jgi:hypothetical protein